MLLKSHIGKEKWKGPFEKSKTSFYSCCTSDLAPCEVGPEWEYATLRLQGAQLYANMFTMQIPWAHIWWNHKGNERFSIATAAFFHLPKGGYGMRHGQNPNMIYDRITIATCKWIKLSPVRILICLCDVLPTLCQILSNYEITELRKVWSKYSPSGRFVWLIIHPKCTY